MKERGIPFTADMVREILKGTKTQTRRIVKELDPENLAATMSKSNWRKVNKELPPDFDIKYFCPYGKPGDRLWVRENYWIDATTKEFKWYVSDVFTPDRDRDHCKLRPSIHMPRKLSRINLEITGVRVQRIQDGGDREFWGEQQWAENPWVWVIEFKKL